MSFTRRSSERVVSIRRQDDFPGERIGYTTGKGVLDENHRYTKGTSLIVEDVKEGVRGGRGNVVDKDDRRLWGRVVRFHFFLVMQGIPLDPPFPPLRPGRTEAI